MHVVRADYYSPIVDPSALPNSVWDRAAPMPGLALDLDAQLELLRSWTSLLREFDPPLHPDPRRPGFFLDNGWYGPMDAHVLYAQLRQLKPGRVLELGSGFSSLVADLALARNAADGRPARHVVVDPFPSELTAHLGDRAEVIAISAAELDSGRFAALGDGDVLFVDTSHAVRPGGEVVRLVLEVLPSLAPGVLIQFHDIFRPFEYPRVLYERFNVHWQEQYLIQAFLAFNLQFEVLCANHALWRLRRPQVQSLFPALREGMEPSGFWFRKQRAG